MECFSSKMTSLAEMVNPEVKNIVPITEEPTTLNRSNDNIVLDHDHFTEKPSSWPHQECNLALKKFFIIRVIFHNLSCFDANFMIQELSKCGQLSVLPINKEKVISFTLHDDKTNIKFRFIGAYRLKFRNHYGTLNDDHFKLLTQNFFSIRLNR